MLRTVLAVATTAAVVAAAPAPAASGFCSPTGDYCYSTMKKDGLRSISFGTFSFRGRVRTCITPPRGARTCRSFALKDSDGGLFAFDVRWGKYFPNRGKGTYRIKFRPAATGTDLGPGVTFKVG